MHLAHAQMWISKQEYDESGPQIVHRKCFAQISANPAKTKGDAAAGGAIPQDTAAHLLALLLLDGR